jgi:hypothetical protein
MRFSFGVFARAFLLLFFSQAITAASCGGGAPPPDSCDTPGKIGAIQTIEVGENAEEFRPFAPGAVVPIVVGGQGISMLPLRFRFTGQDVPECLEVGLVITRFGASTSTMTFQLNTYGDDQSRRDTETLFIVLDRETYYGDAILAVVALGTRYDFAFEFAGDIPEYYQVQLSPAQISIAPGDTAIFEVSRNERPEIPFVLSSSYPKLSLPIEPAGAEVRRFRMRVLESAVAGDHAELRLSHPVGEDSSQILINSAVSPRTGELTIRELLIPRDLSFFPNLDSDDANCDGLVDALDDQFIELLNRTNTSLELEGIELVYTTTSAPNEERIAGVLPARTVGPNENVVIFSGAIGGPRLNPTTACSAYTPGWVNDAVAVGGAGFDLSEATSLELRLADARITMVRFTREEKGHYEIDESDLTEGQPELPEDPYFGFGSPGQTSDWGPFVGLSP